MESRRNSRAVIDPKVRHVGFFTPNAPPTRSQSYPVESNSPPLSDSPASNSLSPVMIPPPRHLSDNLTALRTVAVPVPLPTRRRSEQVQLAGGYDPSESILGTSSPALSPSPSLSNRMIGDAEFSDESSFRRSNSAKFASSLPSGGIDLTTMKTVSIANLSSKKAVGASGTGKTNTAVFQFQFWILNWWPIYRNRTGIDVVYWS